MKISLQSLQDSWSSYKSQGHFKIGYNLQTICMTKSSIFIYIKNSVAILGVLTWRK